MCLTVGTKGISVQILRVFAEAVFILQYPSGDCGLESVIFSLGEWNTLAPACAVDYDCYALRQCAANSVHPSFLAGASHESILHRRIGFGIVDCHFSDGSSPGGAGTKPGHFVSARKYHHSSIRIGNWYAHRACRCADERTGLQHFRSSRLYGQSLAAL
jgi:hypothetical protein